MNLSEKLNLLWKYLLLLVVVWGVYSHTQNRGHSSSGHGGMGGRHAMMMMGGHGDMTWFGDGDMMDVRIEKKIVDGDTTIIAIVDGEEIELDNMSMEDLLLLSIGEWDNCIAGPMGKVQSLMGRVTTAMAGENVLAAVGARSQTGNLAKVSPQVS